MIEEHAVVVERHDSHLVVEPRRQEGCSACGGQGSCGSGLIARALNGRRRLPVMNPGDYRPGDSLVIGLPERAVVEASLFLYLVPLVGLILGGLAGSQLAVGMLTAGDATSAAGGVAGLLAGVMLSRRSISRGTRGRRFEPVVLRRGGHVVEPPG